jgi:hypothetical protein
MKSSLAILAAASIQLLLSAPSASAGAVPSDAPNWSAMIGNGHTSNSSHFAVTTK